MPVISYMLCVVEHCHSPAVRVRGVAFFDVELCNITKFITNKNQSSNAEKHAHRPRKGDALCN
jgi:hypothetical protein